MNEQQHKILSRFYSAPILNSLQQESKEIQALQLWDFIKKTKKGYVITQLGVDFILENGEFVRGPEITNASQRTEYKTEKWNIRAGSDKFLSIKSVGYST